MRLLKIALLVLAISLTTSSCFVVVDHERGHEWHHRDWR